MLSGGIQKPFFHHFPGFLEIAFCRARRLLNPRANATAVHPASAGHMFDTCLAYVDHLSASESNLDLTKNQKFELEILAGNFGLKFWLEIWAGDFGWKVWPEIWARIFGRTFGPEILAGNLGRKFLKT